MNPIPVDIRGLVSSQMYGPEEALSMRRAAWAEQSGMTGSSAVPSPERESWLITVGRRIGAVVRTATAPRPGTTPAPAA